MNMRLVLVYTVVWLANVSQKAHIIKVTPWTRQVFGICNLSLPTGVGLVELACEM
jgi:hypothetical protein